MRRRVLGRPTVMSAGGDEHGVGQSGQARAPVALLGTASAARNHGDGRRVCLRIVVVHEIEPVAGKGPFVLE